MAKRRVPAKVESSPNSGDENAPSLEAQVEETAPTSEPPEKKPLDWYAFLITANEQDVRERFAKIYANTLQLLARLSHEV
jgi:hypothetical protein